MDKNELWMRIPIAYQPSHKIIRKHLLYSSRKKPRLLKKKVQKIILGSNSEFQTLKQIKISEGVRIKTHLHNYPNIDAELLHTKLESKLEPKIENYIQKERKQVPYRSEPQAEGAEIDFKLDEYDHPFEVGGASKDYDELRLELENLSSYSHLSKNESLDTQKIQKEISYVIPEIEAEECEFPNVTLNTHIEQLDKIHLPKSVQDEIETFTEKEERKFQENIIFEENKNIKRDEVLSQIQILDELRDEEKQEAQVLYKEIQEDKEIEGGEVILEKATRSFQELAIDLEKEKLNLPKSFIRELQENFSSRNFDENVQDSLKLVNEKINLPPSLPCVESQNLEINELKEIKNKIKLDTREHSDFHEIFSNQGDSVLETSQESSQASSQDNFSNQGDSVLETLQESSQASSQDNFSNQGDSVLEASQESSQAFSQDNFSNQGDSVLEASQESSQAFSQDNFSNQGDSVLEASQESSQAFSQDNFSNQGDSVLEASQESSQAFSQDNFSNQGDSVLETLQESSQAFSQDNFSNQGDSVLETSQEASQASSQDNFSNQGDSVLETSQEASQASSQDNFSNQGDSVLETLQESSQAFSQDNFSNQGDSVLEASQESSQAFSQDNFSNQGDSVLETLQESSQAFSQDNFSNQGDSVLETSQEASQASSQDNFSNQGDRVLETSQEFSKAFSQDNFSNQGDSVLETLQEASQASSQDNFSNQGDRVLETSQEFSKAFSQDNFSNQGDSVLETLQEASQASSQDNFSNQGDSVLETSQESPQAFSQDNFSNQGDSVLETLQEASQASSQDNFSNQGDRVLETSQEFSKAFSQDNFSNQGDSVLETLQEASQASSQDNFSNQGDSVLETSQESSQAFSQDNFSNQGDSVLETLQESSQAFSQDNFSNQGDSVLETLQESSQAFSQDNFSNQGDSVLETSQEASQASSQDNFSNQGDSVLEASQVNSYSKVEQGDKKAFKINQIAVNRDTQKIIGSPLPNPTNATITSLPLAYSKQKSNAIFEKSNLKDSKGKERFFLEYPIIENPIGYTSEVLNYLSVLYKQPTLLSTDFELLFTYIIKFIEAQTKVPVDGLGLLFQNDYDKIFKVLLEHNMGRSSTFTKGICFVPNDTLFLSEKLIQDWDLDEVDSQIANKKFLPEFLEIYKRIIIQKFELSKETIYLMFFYKRSNRFSEKIIRMPSNLKESIVFHLLQDCYNPLSEYRYNKWYKDAPQKKMSPLTNQILNAMQVLASKGKEHFFLLFFELQSSLSSGLIPNWRQVLSEYSIKLQRHIGDKEKIFIIGTNRVLFLLKGTKPKTIINISQEFCTQNRLQLIQTELQYPKLGLNYLSYLEKL